jgi:hypothetical protein
MPSKLFDVSIMGAESIGFTTAKALRELGLGMLLVGKLPTPGDRENKKALGSNQTKGRGMFFSLPACQEDKGTIPSRLN